MSQPHRSFQVESSQVETLARPYHQTPPLSRESSWRTEANPSSCQPSQSLQFAQPIIRIQTPTPLPTPPLVSDEEAAEALVSLNEAAQRSPGFTGQREATDGAHALLKIANHRPGSSIENVGPPSPSEYSSDDHEPSGPIICHGNYFYTAEISEGNAVWDLLGIKDPSKPFTEHSPYPTLADHNGELQCPRCSITEPHPLGFDGDLNTSLPFHDPGEDTEPLCSDAEDNLELKRGGAAKYSDAHYESRPSPSIQQLGNRRRYVQWSLKEIADKASNDKTKDDIDMEENEPNVLDQVPTTISQAFLKTPIVPDDRTLPLVKPPLASVKKSLDSTLAPTTRSKCRRTGRTASACGIAVSSAPKDKGLEGSLAPSPGTIDAQAKSASTQTATPNSSEKKGKAPARVAAAPFPSKSSVSSTPSINSKIRSSTSTSATRSTITASKRKASSLTLPTPPETPASKKCRARIHCPPSIPAPALLAPNPQPTRRTTEELLGPRIAAAMAKAEAVMVEEEEKKMREMNAELLGMRMPSQRMKKKSTKAVERGKGV